MSDHRPELVHDRQAWREAFEDGVEVTTKAKGGRLGAVIFDEAQVLTPEQVAEVLKVAPATWGGLVESASHCAYCAVDPDDPCALHRGAAS